MRQGLGPDSPSEDLEFPQRGRNEGQCQARRGGRADGTGRSTLSALLSSCGTSRSLGFPTWKRGAHVRSCPGSSLCVVGIAALSQGWRCSPLPTCSPTSERAGVAGPGVQIVAWESGYFCLGPSLGLSFPLSKEAPGHRRVRVGTPWREGGGFRPPRPSLSTWGTGGCSLGPTKAIPHPHC